MNKTPEDIEYQAYLIYTAFQGLMENYSERYGEGFVIAVLEEALATAKADIANRKEYGK